MIEQIKQKMKYPGKVCQHDNQFVLFDGEAELSKHTGLQWNSLPLLSYTLALYTDHWIVMFGVLWWTLSLISLFQ